MSQLAAYKEAGYAASGRGVADASASRLLRNAKVRSRLAEVQEENAYAAQVTVGYISRELRNTYLLATTEKQHGAATQALLGLAKLHGMIVDRAQIEAVIRKPSFDPKAEETMSEAEWFEQFGSKTAIDYQAEPQAAEVYPVDAHPRGGARDDDGGNGKIIDMYADDD